MTHGIDEEQSPVSSGLNLWLELKDPAEMGALVGELLEQREAINRALGDLHYVHFARFVPTPDHVALQVITSFDGEFDAYVMDFVLAIGDQFEMILGYMKDRPPSRVRDDPARFLKYIDDHNLGYEKRGGGGIGLYSAYPGRTVIDIVGASGVAPSVSPPQEVKVTREDVQANVLRGVAWRHALHIGLEFDDPAGARALLGELLAGSHEAPVLGNDGDWPQGIKPAYSLNLGLTYKGLELLGITPDDQAAFKRAHGAFMAGPDDRKTAKGSGDVGPSDPANWELGGSYPVHMVLTLHADDKAALEEQGHALRLRCAVHGLSVVNREWSADALVDKDRPDRHSVHFGYADGLSQPRLAIEDETPGEAEMQPASGVGEFLLGAAYPNVYGGVDSLGGLSPELAQNATFAALRIMEQDVAGFEELLDRASAVDKLDREWLAAKMMGRWRDGTPIVQSRDGPLDGEGAPPRNLFDYLPSEDHPGNEDDSAGMRCPVGAHIRRMNPRSARVAGRPYSRRLLRRGMPYGPAFNPENPRDGQARGLVGMFLCADLRRQYEFILRQWAQGDRATSGLVGQQDPIIGAQGDPEADPPATRPYRIPGTGASGDIVLDMPRLVKTVGSVYLFMPGLAGVRYLAALGGDAKHIASKAAPYAFKFKLPEGMQITDVTGAQLAEPAPDPATFDPRARDFRDDPFTIHKRFREQQPIARLGLIGSTWVFSHRHVEMVAGDTTRFRKRHSLDKSEAGLLNMDPTTHTRCRDVIGPMFGQVLADVAPSIPGAVARVYKDACQGRGQVNWMAAFARPVAQAAFFDLFGLGVDEAKDVIKKTEDLLAIASPRNEDVADALGAMKLELFVMLMFLRKKARPGRLFDRILQTTELFEKKFNKPRFVLKAFEVEQLVNAATFTAAGFLPLQWFIALAIWRLLEKEGVLLRQLKDDPAIGNRAVVDELLRYDMSPPMSDRYVVNETDDIDGFPVTKDDRLTLVWTSANRDEAAFGPNAHTIDFKRGKGPGWAFGAMGEHNCMGRDMVYHVMEPVIQCLRDATPTPQLAPGFTPRWGTPTQSAMFRAMMDLKVIG